MLASRGETVADQLDCDAGTVSGEIVADLSHCDAVTQLPTCEKESVSCCFCREATLLRPLGRSQEVLAKAGVEGMPSKLNKV